MLCFKMKVTLHMINSMVTFRDLRESWNSPINIVQAKLAALDPISKLAQVKEYHKNIYFPEVHLFKP